MRQTSAPGTQHGPQQSAGDGRRTGPEGAGVRHGVEVRAEGWGWQHADRSSPALRGLDLHIAPGERVLLAGPSGAGKSTLLHGLAGVLHDEEASSTGRLLLDGTDPERARGRAGLVQQDPESQVVLSRVGDDVAFAPENLGVPAERIPGRVAEALASVGLEDLEPDHPTARLSGGQKQRLALAGVLAMRPGLLLLDEPTANLDPAGVEQVRDAVLSAAAATGATVIVVEHRLEIWAEHMDTLLVLEPGGGVRRRTAATAVQDDAGLRRELAGMGLWVPGLDPLQGLPLEGLPRSGAETRGSSRTISPASSGHTAQPGRTPADALLTAAQLGVSRTSPRRSWRRTPPPRLTVSGVDLILRSGASVGITGPNGTGKSTLLLTLSGLIPSHAGVLAASERLKAGRQDGDEQGRSSSPAASSAPATSSSLPDDPHRWRSADLVARLGTVFQEPEHQFVCRTVREELALGAREARRPGSGEPLFTAEEVSRRTEEMLRRLRLADLAEANPFTLSGGEKRRLSVGTVLAAGPQVLMLDEPTFGQDAATFTELVLLLREHLGSGGTVVAVTHDQAFLDALEAEEFTLEPAARRPEEPAAEPSARTQQDRPDAGKPSGPPMLGGGRSPSWLGRRSALAKLIGVLLITGALVMTIDWVSSAVVVAASLLLLPLAGIRIGTFLGRIWPFLVGAVVAVWGTAVAAEESGQVLLDLGFTTVSEGSVTLGVALGLRAVAIVLPSVIVFSTTDPTDLADSLAQQLRLPARFVLGALAAMRLLGLLAEHWTTLGHARRARGLGAQRGFARRLRSTLSQAFGLLVQAIRMAVRLAVTMECRGFGAGPRTWARKAQFRAADGPVIIGGVALATLAIWAAVVAGTWNFVWT